jgi:DNA-binding XRE family transcriptional regulator
MHLFCAAQISTIGERQASGKLVSTIVEMDAKVVIGRFIRHLREQQGLTQDQLAGQIDLTYQYLSGLENGRENFSIGQNTASAGFQSDTNLNTIFSLVPGKVVSVALSSSAILPAN